MNIYDIKRYLKQIYDDEISKYSEKLVLGRVADYSEYRHLVGRIQGLTDAKALLDKLTEGEEPDE